MTIHRFTGLSAFLVVLFVMPLGHALMILMEHLLGHGFLFTGAIILGMAGVILVFTGARSSSETTGTWLGFFGGILVWTGWVEFSYVFFAQHLSIDPLIKNGEVATKPEYLLMTSSVGLLLATLLYFLFNGRTRCHFFVWVQERLHLGIKAQPAGAERDYSIITFMETTFILWFFYILLLLVYDDRILGDRHPATYIVLVGSLIWSIYLFVRLMKIRRMAPAIRYAIPTVIIFWNAVEILARWEFFKEIWVHPMHYAGEMGLILLAFIFATWLAVRFR